MNDCDVCLMGADDVMNDFYHESTLTARKPHVCGECHGVIPLRASYQRAVGKSEDGDIFTTKTCALCAEIRTVFYCGGSWYFGQLWEDMEDQAFPNLTTASPCFRELSPQAKAFVLERWNAWRGLASKARGQEER